MNKAAKGLFDLLKAKAGFDKVEAYIKQFALKPADIKKEVQRNLGSVYKKQVDGGQLRAKHPELPKWAIDKVKPHLQQELYNRTLANIKLITLNQEESTAKTLASYQGWLSSSVDGAAELAAVPEKLMKEYTERNDFYNRRVTVDQAHKLQSALSNIVAADNGAIACRWKSQYRRLNYDARKEHKERDGKIYLIRDSWADKAGLVKQVDGYYDEITQAGEEVYCSCVVYYIYAISKLPEEMITKKGLEYLEFKS